LQDRPLQQEVELVVGVVPGEAELVVVVPVELVVLEVVAREVELVVGVVPGEAELVVVVPVELVERREEVKPVAVQVLQTETQRSTQMLFLRL